VEPRLHSALCFDGVELVESLYLLQFVTFISLGILLFTNVQFPMHEIITYFNFPDNFDIPT
jgi:hypothetical protein